MARRGRKRGEVEDAHYKTLLDGRKHTIMVLFYLFLEPGHSHRPSATYYATVAGERKNIRCASIPITFFLHALL